MSEPHDHHFIPAFYLRSWAAADNLLCQFSKVQGKLLLKRVGPRGTGFQVDLYAFPDLPQDKAMFLEKEFFGYADQVAAQALELHLSYSKGAWNSELATGWSRFLIGIHLRHPDAIPELREAARFSWENSGEEHQAEYQKIRRGSDPILFDDYLLKKDPFTAAKMQLNLIIKALDNEIICTQINSMIYSVIDLSTANNRLFTSDRPVEIFALANPEGLISIPISPTKLFVAANESRTFESLRMSDPNTVVHNVNLHTVSRARRFVWASHDSGRRFVEKHMSTAMEALPLFPSMSRQSDRHKK